MNICYINLAGPVQIRHHWRRVALAAFTTLWSSFSIAQSPENAAIAAFNKDVQPLLSKYCYDCHGGGMKEGKVEFDQLKTSADILNRDLWQRAIKNVRAGIMPPAAADQPSAAERKVLEGWIKRDVFGIDSSNPDPGRVTIRRLNRVEYRNTIRELMGIDFNTDEEFPPDDTGHGFDNIGEVLVMSPVLLEKYMSAAERIIHATVPDVSKVTPEKILAGTEFARVGGAVDTGGGRRGGGGADRLPFASAGKYAQKFKIEEAGDYRLKVEFTVFGGGNNFDPGQADISVALDGQQIYKNRHGWEDEFHGRKFTVELNRKWEPGEREFVFELEPVVPDEQQPPVNPQQVAQPVNPQQQADGAQAAAQNQAAQQNQVADPAQQAPAGRGQGGRGRGAGGARRSNNNFRINAVHIHGPLDEAHRVAPANYARYFSLESAPTPAAERRQYARQVLRPFVTKAFRRPADEPTLDRLANVSETYYSQPGKTFEQGIQQAMIAVLASPRFLFRIEDAAADAKANQPFSDVDEYSLASRLSYLLWSTMPDEELFALAGKGELRKNLDLQVKRMLADRRSESFVSNFVGQWLRTREVDSVSINARVVLARDAGTEAQMRAEDEAAAVRAAEIAARGLNAAQDAQQQNQDAQQQAVGQQNQQQNDAAAAAQDAPAAPADANPAAVRGRRGGRGGRGAQQAQAPQVENQQQAEAPAGAAAQDPQQNQQNAQAQAQDPAAAAQAQGARGGRGAGAAGAGGRGGRRGGGAATPELDKELRTAMRLETDMYFSRVVHEDRSVLELIDSNYTYLNQRLAQHYGIPDVAGPEMRLVTLPEGSPRGGVLTHGSILTITSQSTRTSAVKRGLFVLDSILGTPAPPAPPDVPPLDDAEKTFQGREPTLRETLELHRSQPICAGCHERMDPLGLALENFNALGMWRTRERGQDIRVEGSLITGEKIGSVQDLRKILTNERRSDYYNCLTEKLMVYALGRGLEYYDSEAVDQIVKRLEDNDGKFSALLMGVIESAPFQKRRNGAASMTEAAPQRELTQQDKDSRTATP